MKISSVLALATTITGALGASQALAQKPAPVVRDAIYRGMLVCSRLPFVTTLSRTALEANVAGNAVRYRRPVVMALSGAREGYEEGSGSIDGDKISLKGAWKKGADGYEASYSGSFVRRSAKLTGTQNWNYQGQSYTATCTGAIQRPLAAFLPKDKKN
jgi:hypothetical protein